MVLSARLRWLWLTLGVVLLDRATKAFVESRPLGYFPRTVVANFFSLVDSRNPALAFSFLSGLSSPALRAVIVVSSLVILGVISWLLVAGSGMSAFSCAGLALILGGATGNVTDRILHGAVTDFLEFTIRFIPLRVFNPWPAFNVADSAITIGALCILLDVLFGHRSAKANISPAREL